MAVRALPWPKSTTSIKSVTGLAAADDSRICGSFGDAETIDPRLPGLNVREDEADQPMTGKPSAAPRNAFQRN